MKTKKYWLAINSYRNSTSSGFDNTWYYVYLDNKADRDRILSEGLEVSDSWYPDGTAVKSTMGIRLLDSRELSAVNRKCRPDYDGNDKPEKFEIDAE